MTEPEKAFLAALKNMLHPDSCTLHPAGSTDMEKEPDAETDWMAVLNMAKKQSLLPLVYDAATAYPSFTSVEDSLTDYFTSAIATMSKQMQKTDAFLALYRSFLAAGLAPITMKGIICRDLYGERADYRPSGDEDILIEKKDYERAVAVLESCGYEKEEDPDKDMAVIQEVTFHGTDLSIELHLNPFGVSSARRERMNDWFKNVFQSEETVQIKGVPVRTMQPTDHFLFLVFHAFKHFLFSGFGVRMMLDILLFAEKYGDRIDWDYIDRGLTDVGANGFLADLMEIGNRYLGFFSPQGEQREDSQGDRQGNQRGDSQGEQQEKQRGDQQEDQERDQHRAFSMCFAKTVCPDDLLEDMFQMGTFGNTSDADRTAGRIVADTLQKEKHRESRLGSYLRLLFPSWKTWCAWRPYLKDRPWMVVCEWFRRVARYLRGETSTSSLKELDKSYGIAEERMALLGKYGVL